MGRSRTVGVYVTHYSQYKLDWNKNFGILLLALLAVFSTIPAAMSENQHLKAVVEGNGAFTQKLYNILAKEPGNIFFSPISAHTVLSMAYQGAKGSTLEAFSKSLSIPEPENTAEGYNAVISKLSNVPNVTLLIANKIYVKDGYNLQNAFKTVVQKQFQSEVESVDFKESAVAAGKINSWVEQKTNSKIKDLIEKNDLGEDTRLVLLNAIYFKGNWADKFDPANTQTQKFYVNDNETIDVQMMFRKSKYNYKNDETLDAKVLELPYANKDLSLIIILPNDRNGIDKLEEKLATVDITKITNGMFRPEVNVYLPKFKIEQTIQLNAPLKQLGLEVAFGPKANFTGMIDSEEPLYVSKVVQKAFIEVNEEGAEAAAATGLMVNFRMALIPMPTEDFRADHPFIVNLVHRTGEHREVLFHGRVSNPK